MEMTMKKTVIGLSLAALVLAGGAYAAPGAPGLKRDMDRNGTITRAEMQQAVTASFARLDVNKDGKLDRADRAARAEERKTRMFDRLDTNKDGQIARAEFMADRGPGQDGAREGRRGMGRHHGGPGRMMGGKRTGANGTGGAMTQAEFVAAALQRFDARDANKDGQLTQAERQTAREQRQQLRTSRAQS